MSAPSVSPHTVVARRSDRPHTSMFVRMLIRAALLRRGRAASALLFDVHVVKRRHLLDQLGGEGQVLVLRTPEDPVIHQ